MHSSASSESILKLDRRVPGDLAYWDGAGSWLSIFRFAPPVKADATAFPNQSKRSAWLIYVVIMISALFYSRPEVLQRWRLEVFEALG